MDKRLFSSDEATGVRKIWHWDSSNDTFVIETEMAQPVLENILEENKQTFNDAPSAWGDGQKVASIPIHIYWDLKKKGIIDDEVAFKRWLNDPDQRAFRTRPGTI